MSLIPVRPFVLPRHQTNQFNTDFSDEKEGSTAFYGWQVLRGNFVMEGRKMKGLATDCVAKANNVNGRDFSIKFKAAKSSPIAGVLFRMQDADNFYMARFNSSAGGVLEVGKRLAGTLTNIASVPMVATDPIIEVKCIGSKITIRAVGKEFYVIDTSFPSGGLGLRSANAGGDYWDWIRAEYS